MITDPILLVDDEEDLRVFLRDSLTQDGFLIEEAADARSALALMEARHYAVVLTDLNMPGGPTGFDLIQAVKARDPRTLCVVITGYASMETAIQAVKFGAYDFVQKPFKLAEIEAVLDRALNHAAVLSQLADYQKDLEDRVLARVKDLKDFQDEVLLLNDLLVASQDHLSEGPLLQPFLEHLRTRFAPAAVTVLLPEGAGWKQLSHSGSLPAAAQPAPWPLESAAEWASVDGVSEGYLVPLRGKSRMLAALHLQFPWRHSFVLDDQSFLFWRRQAEAALHGLARTRDHLQQLGRPHVP